MTSRQQSSSSSSRASNMGGGSRVIRVTNIAPQATRDQMQTLLTFVGKVEEIKLYPTVRDVAIPVASRVSFVKFFDRDHVGIAQHLNNTVFIDRALIIVPYENPDIPDERTAMQALVQANGVLGVTSEEQLPAHVTNVVDGASYITRDPTFAEHGVPDYPSLPCTLEYGQVEEIRRTVVVGNLAPSADANQAMEWLADAGEIKYARMCGRDTDESRACIIEFSDQASVIPAMLKSGQQLGDRTLVVAHASTGIAKPQIKTNEMAQREIEEAMRRAQEQQSLISSTMQPVTSYMDEAKRSRSRERGGRRRRSRSRDRRRHTRSRSPRLLSRGKYSPIRDRRRSRSRDHKSRSRRSRSRSRDRSGRSRHRTRSRDRKKDDKDKDRRGGSRDKDRRDKDRNRDKDKDRSRDKDKEKSDKSRSKESPEKMAKKESSHKSASLSKEKSSKDSSRARSRSPARKRSRSPVKKRSRSRSAERRRSGRGGRGMRSSPGRHRSRSRSRHHQRRPSRSPARRRSRSPGRKRSRSPRASQSRASQSRVSQSRTQRSPERDSKRRDRDKDHKRDKDRREKDPKSEKTDAKVSRDYDEEEKGFDEEAKKSVSRDASPARSAAEKGKEDKSTPAGDDMDISE